VSCSTKCCCRFWAISTGSSSNGANCRLRTRMAH
jgi:hypothetical protein